MIALLSFVFRFWRYIVLSMAFFSVGFYVAWHVQDIRIKRMANGLEAEAIKLKECISVNEVNQETIAKLKLEVQRANRLCSARLKTKEKTLKRLQEIDDLPKVEKTEEEDEKENTNDPILHELNRMFK